MSNQDWQALEKSIAMYFRKKGYAVEIEAKVRSRTTGRNFRVDVLATHELPGVKPFVLAVEAKLYSRKLEPDEVRAIVSRLNEIDIDRGLIYAPGGVTAQGQSLIANSTVRLDLHTEGIQKLIESSWGDDFVSAVPKIIDLRSKEPNSEDASWVLLTLRHSPYYSRLFLHDLGHPEWIAVFDKEGLVEKSAVEQAPLNPYQLSEALVRFVEIQFGPFLNFARSLRDPSPHIQSTILQAVTRLSDQQLQDLARAVRSWNFRHFYDTENLSALLTALSNRQQDDLVLDILRALLKWDIGERAGIFDTLTTELHPRVNQYDFEKVSVSILPPLVTRSPVFVDLPCELLGEAMRSVADNTELLILSPMRRPVIKLSGDDYRERTDVLNSLVTSYYETLRRLYEVWPDQAREHIRSQLTNPLSGAHLRVTIQCIAEFVARDKEVFTCLVDTDLVWNDYYVLPELHQLVVNLWHLFSNEERIRILARLMDPPELRWQTHKDASEESERRDDFIVDWLLRVRALEIPAQIRVQFDAQLDRLISKTGRKEPQADTFGRITWLREAVPVEVSAFPDWTAKRIIEYLLSFVPDSSPLSRSTPEGLADKFADQVAVRPNEFFEYISLMKSFKFAAYWSAFFNGLEKSLRDPLIQHEWDLMLYSMEVGVELLDGLDPVAGSRATRSWVLDAIASTFGAAATNYRLPAKDESTVSRLCNIWLNLLARSAEGSHIQISDEDSPDSTDWVMHVLNSSHGRLGNGIAVLARNLARNESKTLERVLALIREHVLASNSPLLRSPVATYWPHYMSLPNMADFVTSSQEPLFEVEEILMWSACWTLYFRITSRILEAFRRLEKAYCRSFSHLDSLAGGVTPKWCEPCGQDIGLFWSTGETNENSPVIRELWKMRRPEIKEAATMLIGSRLLGPDYENWDLAITWWQLAIKNANSTTDKSYLAAFTSWVGSIPNRIPLHQFVKELAESIRQEAHHLYPDVDDFLQERVQVEPNEVSELLRSISQVNSKDTWFTNFSKLAKIAERLFESPLSSDGRDNLREAVIAFLGKWGRLEFEGIAAKLGVPSTSTN